MRDRLPLSLSSFIGRADELGQLEPLVLTQRLVTLTGSGGAGKTRLAYEVASRLRAEFADGVVAVELAAASDLERVPHLAAEAVGLLEREEQGLVERLAAFLEGRNLLLVLDNCEHVVEACAGLVAALLSSCCVDLRILATSREPLGVPGEVAWRVPPLAQPPSGASVEDLVHLEAWDATRLFLERARTALPSFTASESDAGAIAAICARLDGMPLAIELAAARVTVLTPEQIAQRLEQGLGLLRSQSRTGPARHQTLAATIEWSYRLLDAREAAVLDRMSVFRGGWTLQAAEAVCGSLVDPPTILEILAQLVAKSLVVSEPHDGVMRYRLLETIRQYAGERLVERGEAEETGERHLGYYVSLAERSQPELQSWDQLKWAYRLDLEQDNFRAALGFALARAPESDLFAEQALRLVIAMDDLWFMRSQFTEAKEWFERVLAEERTQAYLPLRAQALLMAWRHVWLVGFAGGDPYLEEGLAIARKLGPGHEQIVASALHRLGVSKWSSNDLAPARSLLEQSVAHLQQAGDLLQMAEALVFLGSTWAHEDSALARQLYEQSIEIQTQHGNLFRTLLGRHHLAELHLTESNYPAAYRLFHENLAEARKYGWVLGVDDALLGLARVLRRMERLDEAEELATTLFETVQEAGWHNEMGELELGYVALEQRNLGRAQELFRASLNDCRRIEDEVGVADCLVAFARVRCMTGRMQAAARLLGAAEVVLSKYGGRTYLHNQPDVEVCRRLVRSKLSERAFAAEFNKGGALSLEEATALALSPEEGRGLPQTALTSRQAVKARYGGLTARERELAGRVAKGLTNREIAAELFVTERTVEAHVSNILSKLEFTSRAQIAVWAVNKGLATAPDDPQL